MSSETLPPTPTPPPCVKLYSNFRQAFYWLSEENNASTSISGREITERASIEMALDTQNLDRISFQPHVVEESLLYDSTRDDKPFNTNQYPGFDMDNQYIGLEVPLDKRYRINKSKEKSPNAMDTNWGGVKYARDIVASGVYDENTGSSFD